MPDDICPHCTHPWHAHNSFYANRVGEARCFCGCMWTEPKPTEPEPPQRDPAVDRLECLLWDAFEAVADGDGPFTPYVDRDMDMIDSSGAGVNMAAVAEHLYAALHPDNPEENL